MKKIGLVLGLVVLLSGVTNAQVINEKSSVVNFNISNMKTKTVEGTFGGMKGEINFNVDDLANSSLNVCVDAASVNTENEKRDKHLRNEDFFEVETYPTICFQSESVFKTSDGYQSIGQLTMHGVTKGITIDFTFENGTFVGELEISRFDYKIGEGTNTFMVGEIVSLEIICLVE